MIGGVLVDLQNLMELFDVDERAQAFVKFFTQKVPHQFIRFLNEMLSMWNFYKAWVILVFCSLPEVTDRMARSFRRSKNTVLIIEHDGKRIRRKYFIFLLAYSPDLDGFVKAENFIVQK